MPFMGAKREDSFGSSLPDLLLQRRGKTRRGARYACARGVDRRRKFRALKPFGELESQQLAEERTDGNAGKKIAGTADYVPFFFIISINRTIKGHLHEVVERDWPPRADFGADFFNEFLHWRKMVRI